MTSKQALANALDWAEGRRSWINITHADTYERRLEVVAVQDAQEVVKWAALSAALAVAESAAGVPATDTEGQDLGSAVDNAPDGRSVNSGVTQRRDET